MTKIIISLLALCIVFPLAITFSALADEPQGLTIESKNEDGSAYMPYAIYLMTGPGNTSVYLHSGSEGIITDSLNGLPSGTYTVVELNPPYGCKYNPQALKFEYDGSTAEPSTLTFHNEELEVLILKVVAKDGWKEDDDYEHELLPDAVFRITRKYVEPIPVDTIVDFGITPVMAMSSDEWEEEVTAEDGTYRLKLGGWSPGTYIVQETTPPSGYKLDPTPQEFTIEEGRVTPSELVFRNEPLEVEVIKISAEDGSHIPGAWFRVRKQQVGFRSGGFGDEWEYYFEVGEHPFILTLGGWDVGVYEVVEDWPPSGYKLDPEPQYFEIVGDGTVSNETLTFENEPLVLRIEKRCSDSGELLPGAKFRIRKIEYPMACSIVLINGFEFVTMFDGAGTDDDDDDYYYYDYDDDYDYVIGDDGNPWEVFVTAYDGTYLLNLAGWGDGTYVVKEVEPPKGYSLSRGSKEFTIVGDGTLEPEVLTFENDPLGLYIGKICAVTKEVLSGAVFNIMGVDSNVNFNVYDEDGGVYVSLAGLDDGTYIVTEIKTPVGYKNDAEPQEFEIVQGEVSVEGIVFENHPEDPAIPQTGAEGLPVWVLPALVVLGAAALVVTLKIAKGRKR